MDKWRQSVNWINQGDPAPYSGYLFTPEGGKAILYGYQSTAERLFLTEQALSETQGDLGEAITRAMNAEDTLARIPDIVREETAKATKEAWRKGYKSGTKTGVIGTIIVGAIAAALL